MLGQFVGLRPDVFKIAESTSPLWTLRTSSDRAAGKWRPKQALNPRFIIRLFRGVISDRFESTVNLLHLMLAKAAETLSPGTAAAFGGDSLVRNQHNSFCAAFRRGRLMA